MVSKLIFLTFLISNLFSINECADHIPIESNQSHKHPTKAIVILTGSNGVSGQVTFQQTDTFESMKITGTISGLSAGLHGFHVHQYGNLVNGCTSAGSHFNPMSYNHSAQTERIRHAGDLGNIEANENGEAVVNISDDILMLEGKNSILGRAVVVHALRDDLGQGGNADSLTTGNAGTRLACGIVGLAEEGLISLMVVG